MAIRFLLKKTEEMELCSIEDAFPNIQTGSVAKGERDKGSGFPYVGGTDDRPSREERRAARKKAKRCKGTAAGGPASKYIDATREDVPDPDRPAAMRMGPVEAFQASAGAASTEEEVVYPVPLAKQNPKLVPVLPKPSCLFSDEGYPSYFGKSEDDMEENFSSYGPDDTGYRLEPDFTKSFDFKGVQKAAGGALPVPNLEDSWKPMTEAASYTSFTPSGATAIAADALWSISAGEHPVVVPGAAEEREQRAPVVAAPVVLPAGGNKQEDRDALLARIDTLVGRLENLEKKRVQDTQNELLVFVGTGLFMLLAFEIVVRK